MVLSACGSRYRPGAPSNEHTRTQPSGRQSKQLPVGAGMEKLLTRGATERGEGLKNSTIHSKLGDINIDITRTRQQVGTEHLSASMSTCVYGALAWCSRNIQELGPIAPGNTNENQSHSSTLSTRSGRRGCIQAAPLVLVNALCCPELGVVAWKMRAALVKACGWFSLARCKNPSPALATGTRCHASIRWRLNSRVLCRRWR
jgi:hypothetical protein